MLIPLALISWNKRADGMFSYSRCQTIGKVHVDELFYDNYWRHNTDEFSAFNQQWKTLSGVRDFILNVRIKTVSKEG